MIKDIKIAKAKFKVLNLIKNRWSARSFSDKNVNQEDILTLIEAASWSFSANNEQPWRFIFATKGSENFDKLVVCLMPGNKPWARNAAAFVVSMAKTTFEKEGNPANPIA
jgi:nitroreductase